MQHEIQKINAVRQGSEGISPDKVIELGARVVFLSLICFHQRVRSFYELKGDEDEQQLRDKRRDFGTCKRIIPREELQSHPHLM